jgi:hypothetical protein
MTSRIDYLGTQGLHIRLRKSLRRRGSPPSRGCTTSSEHVYLSITSEAQASRTDFCMNGPMYIIAAQLSPLAAVLLPFLQLDLSKGGQRYQIPDAATINSQLNILQLLESELKQLSTVPLILS